MFSVPLCESFYLSFAATPERVARELCGMDVVGAGPRFRLFRSDAANFTGLFPRNNSSIRKHAVRHASARRGIGFHDGRLHAGESSRCRRRPGFTENVAVGLSAYPRCADLEWSGRFAYSVEYRACE